MRKRSGNRFIIGSHVVDNIREKSHRIDAFFDIKKITFINSKKNVETSSTQPVVYCSDVISFLDYIKQKRNVSDVHIKLGIDGGGQFLKICLSVMQCSELEVKRVKLDKVHESEAKDTGVKKLFILALAPNVQENHNNITLLWKLLKIDGLYNTIAADLKLLNILLGIGPHSSMYPCLWCTSNKNELAKFGVKRTFENCSINYSEYCKAGSKKKDAQNFFSCINSAIITTNNSTIDLCDVLPPPQLHLLIGIVNHVLSYLMKEFKVDAQKWIKACNVHVDKRNGGASFNGNACRNLLRKADDLRNSKTYNIGCVKYAEICVVKDCFGNELVDGYEKSIDDFKNCYLKLNISVTPKAHTTFYHVKEFCTKNEKSLGFYSEQAFESVHHDFLKVWSHFKVSENHAEFQNKLLNATRRYNGLHI